MNSSEDAPHRASRRFGGRWLRPTLVCLGSWVALAVIFYAEEDWRGQRDWNRYRHEVEARGESLDFRAYIPKPIPGAENFAATPTVKSWFRPDGSDPLTNDLFARVANNIPETKIMWDKAPWHFLDLVAWQLASAALQSGALKPKQEFKTDKTDLAARALAAPSVLEGMKSDEAEFAELRAAATRQHSRYPLFYDLDEPWKILMPHQAKIKEVCNRLSLEACAELAAGQSDHALADVKLMLFLADSIKSDPFLISPLVRAALVGIAIQPVWEGLAEHRWSDAELQVLQARFLSYDLLADMQKPINEERAVGLLMVDSVKKEGFGRMFPTGWWYQEKLNYVTLIDAQMKGVVDLAVKKISPSISESNANEKTRQLSGVASGSRLEAILHHRLVAAMLEPALGKTYKRIAISQITADQVALGCALERYRLANGQFPEKLDSLTPQYISRLPNDVITGQPYKYRRADDGQFILYSVGWNEKDDGGVPGTHGLYDDKEGDWIWDYPAK
jgi:hypothetical protein